MDLMLTAMTTTIEFDRISYFGLGIPDDPSEEEAKRVLLGLHIGSRFKWHNGGATPVECLRWTDGYRSRFWAERQDTA